MSSSITRPGDAVLSPGRPPIDDRFFRSLIERSTELMVVLDERAILRYVNPASYDFLGYRPEEAIGRCAFEFVEPADLGKVQSHFAALLADPAKVSTAEYSVLHRDGTRRVVRGIARNLLDDDAVRGIVVHAHDITARRQTEDALAQSREQYRSLFEYNPNAVYSLDMEGCFTSANPACATVTGLRPDELIGRSFEPLIRPEYLERARANFRAALAGHSSRDEIEIVHSSGRHVRLSVTNVPIFVDERVVGFFGIAEDLTAHHELEQQLRQAQKMEAVGRLAGGVAHDFNNLLTVIQSYTQLVLAEVPEDAAVLDDLREVQDAARRATELTRQLLAFSRRQMLQARRVDANRTVSDVAGMLRRVIGEDVQLVEELAPVLWPVHADPGQLEQVLMNLAVNARDAMSSGGTLRLGTANVTVNVAAGRERPGLLPGEYVALTVEDTGSGIAPEVLPHIFEPFFTTKGPGHGTGLGLATVYGIIKQSGGYVYVDSTPGVGSRFTVLLPRSTEAAERSTRATQPSIPLGTETILVVEDESTVRIAVRRMLGALGYTIVEAASAAEALELVAEAESRDAPIHLVLTDVVMPERNGRELGEALAGRWPQLRVLYMSGYTDDEILRRGLVQSEGAFLAKPFTAEQLAHAVRRVLDRPAGAPMTTG